MRRFLPNLDRKEASLFVELSYSKPASLRSRLGKNLTFYSEGSGSISCGGHDFLSTSAKPSETNIMRLPAK